MTVGELKALLDLACIDDSTEIKTIDIDHRTEAQDLEVYIDGDGELIIN